MAKQKSSVRTRSLILLVLLVTLSGCIVTYRDFPNATLESLPKNHEPKLLYYHVEPIFLWNKEYSRQVAGTIMVVFPNMYRTY